MDDKEPRTIHSIWLSVEKDIPSFSVYNKNWIQSNHACILKTGFLTYKQIMDQISNYLNKNNLKANYKFTLVEGKTNPTYGYGYLWSDNIKVISLMTGFLSSKDTSKKFIDPWSQIITDDIYNHNMRLFINTIKRKVPKNEINPQLIDFFEQNKHIYIAKKINFHCEKPENYYENLPYEEPKTISEVSKIEFEPYLYDQYQRKCHYEELQDKRKKYNRNNKVHMELLSRFEKESVYIKIYPIPLRLKNPEKDDKDFPPEGETYFENNKIYIHRKITYQYYFNILKTGKPVKVDLWTIKEYFSIWNTSSDKYPDVSKTDNGSINVTFDPMTTDGFFAYTMSKKVAFPGTKDITFFSIHRTENFYDVQISREEYLLKKN